MGLPILDLVATLADRRSELLTLVPDAAGSTRQLICSTFADYFVENVDRLNAWVYCPRTSLNAGTNMGEHRRATTYHQAGTSVDFARAWPEALTNAHGPATYYMTTRTPWWKLRDAVNAGIADLAIPYAGPITQEFPVVEHQYRYTLPSLPGSIVATLLEEVSVSISTEGNYVGYPYATATPYNWRLYTTTESDGSTAYEIQFEQVPPTGSLVRLYGRAPLRSTGRTSDSGVVACDPQYDDVVQEYLLMHASYLWAKWDVDSEPVGKALYALQIATAALTEARATLLERLPRGPNARIVVPGRGDGRQLAHPGGDDASWLGASHQLH